MSSFSKNKNNYFENLTGEVIHIYWKNPNIKIIPITILFNKIPIKNNQNIIKKFDIIDFDKDLINYNILKEKKNML